MWGNTHSDMQISRGRPNFWNAGVDRDAVRVVWQHKHTNRSDRPRTGTYRQRTNLTRCANGNADNLGYLTRLCAAAVAA